VRKLIKIVIVALGIRALWRWWRRRNAAPEPARSTTAATADPADDLRRKLAESREDEVVEAQSTPTVPVEDRRADVHEQARAAVDEMKSAGGD
jgi:transposase-like protein